MQNKTADVLIQTGRKEKEKPKRNDKKDEKYFAEGKEYRGISAQLT